MSAQAHLYGLFPNGPNGPKMKLDQIDLAIAPFNTTDSPFEAVEVKSLPFEDDPFPVHVLAGIPDHMIRGYDRYECPV